MRSHIARSVVEDYGVSAERVRVVGGGVKLPALPPPVDRDPDREPTVLFIGAELRRKGGYLLLRAFARARRAAPAARLVLVRGERVPGGWPLEGVTVRPPTWDRAAVVELFRAADVFALPSRLETWGDVLLEAMAFGLPCVGVAGDAMGEIIDDRVTGAIVPAGDVEALSAVLVDLL